LLLLYFILIIICLFICLFVYSFVCLFIRNCSDDDLEKALKMSEQEALDEEKRKREKLEKDNAENLFGTPAT
jgi:hypothetical protein